MPIVVTTPRGFSWSLENANKKLEQRATLPGARVWDLASVSLRSAFKKGVSRADRFALALPASWMVNSPANSKVMRRWALAPQRDAWLALIESLEQGPHAWLEDDEMREAVKQFLPALGDDRDERGAPILIEAASKFLALLVPEMVPLMPAPARTFILGEDAPNDASSFVAMLDWFAKSTLEHERDLDLIAQDHAEVPLTGAQALDRLLWFDSEGHRHFEK